VRKDENELLKRILWINPESQTRTWPTEIKMDWRGRNWRADAQDADRSRHLLDEIKVPPGM